MGLVFNVAIEAMKNAHKEEMEKTHRSQLSGLNSDIDELRLQYEYDFFDTKTMKLCKWEAWYFLEKKNLHDWHLI